ncbi:queuosine precursor transporter [Roseobacteraceae bacterium S113]
MTRQHIPGIIAMAIIVMASNILVQFLFGNWLTWGAFTYPLAFLVTDVMNRVYGAGPARQVVFAGFVVGIFCSLVGTNLDASILFEDRSGPLVTFRVAIASGLAFLTAQLLDVAIFNRFRNQTWWRAPLASTVVGSSVDTAIFFTLAFSQSFSFIDRADDVSWAGDILPMLGAGPDAPLWVSLAVADWLVKLSLALIALVPFRLLVNRIGARTTLA